MKHEWEYGELLTDDTPEEGDPEEWHTTKRTRRHYIVKGRLIKAGWELKTHDAALSNFTLTAGTAATGGEEDPSPANCLNGIGQGDTGALRDGRKYVMKSIYINGMIRANSQDSQTSLDLQPLVFIALVLDKQTNGAQLNSEDVFQNIAGSSVTAAIPLRNIEYASRFTVLATKHILIRDIIAAYNGTNMSQSGVQFPWCIKKKFNIPVTCTGTGATVSDISDNSLHIIAFKSFEDLNVNVWYQSRIRFYG